MMSFTSLTAAVWAHAPTLLALSLGEALFVLTAFRVADKYRLWERYDLNRRPSWPVTICRLCLAFWAAQLAGLPLTLAHPEAALCPFLSAGLTVLLYRWSQ